MGRSYVGTFKGRVRQPRENWVMIPIPAIIDQATFDAVGERLTLNRQRSKRNRKRLYLLSAYTLTCGACGGGMSGFTNTKVTTSGRTFTYISYLCNAYYRREDIKACHPSVRAEHIDPHVWGFVERVLTYPKTILEAIAFAQQGGVKQRLDAQRCVEALDQRIVENSQEDMRLIEAYQGGAMTVEELKQHRQRLAMDKQVLIDERWQAQEALSRFGALPPEPYELDTYIGFVQESLKTGSLEEKSQVIEKLGIMVTYTPGQPLKIQGTVPSATLGALCTFEVQLADEMHLTEYP